MQSLLGDNHKLEARVYRKSWFAPAVWQFAEHKTQFVPMALKQKPQGGACQPVLIFANLFIAAKNKPEEIRDSHKTTSHQQIGEGLCVQHKVM